MHGRSQAVETEGLDGGFVVHAGGRSAPVRIEPIAGSQWWRLVTDDQAVPVRMREEAGVAFVTIGATRVALTVRRALPIPSRRSTSPINVGRVEVRAPMPGLVVAILPAGGEEVQAGGVVAIVEAMKMQMEVPSPAAGRIEEIRVRPGQEVAGGQVLAVVRTANADDAAPGDNSAAPAEGPAHERRAAA